ncbi:uncharacterized protein DNG_07287 [Cephalotrichum gorgonifer]|uniref:Zn(2)-C6 fungal-type domain-containing protein n=1 Tax=Cephalotrichum gorgonifer TaxID=2041049 RepID=A0AAE8N4A3_9PEZI|nr:uncharacterized protein DNG_07287 [Cephalotrichum gorgonifer]
MPVTANSTSGPSFGLYNSKSCDACRARKVRCTGPGAPGPCEKCKRRKETCHFSPKRFGRRGHGTTTSAETGQLMNGEHPSLLKSIQSPALTASPKPSTPTEAALKGTWEQPLLKTGAVVDSLDWDTPAPRNPTSGTPETPGIPELCVDRLLARARGHATPRCQQSSGDAAFIRWNGIFGGRNSLTFFTDSRLQSLEQCLGNTRINEIVGRATSVIDGRIRRADPAYYAARRDQGPSQWSDSTVAASYMQVYFDRVHPIYPILDKSKFQGTVSSPDFPHVLTQNKAWACLYHAVLAIASQHTHGGSFEPAKGESSKIFIVALANFSDLVLLPDSLLVLQALAAMAIYVTTVSGLAVEQAIMSEAARRAQNLSSTNFGDHDRHIYQRAFWVLYGLEKMSSFHFGRISSFVDNDISCPVPYVPESVFDGFNWFLTFITHARLTSRVYISLFSAGVTGNSSSYYLSTVAQLSDELASWRMALPDTGFRPGGLVRPHGVAGAQAKIVALTTHYLYYSIKLSLSRTALLHLPGSPESSSEESITKPMLDAARSILDLTALIEVEPYTPILVLAGIPITALFVLFDFVIQNPLQPETSMDLALLDIAGGHFSRIDYATGGSLPGSLVSEFAHIARDYVKEVHRRHGGTWDSAVPQSANPAVARPRGYSHSAGDPAVRIGSNAAVIGAGDTVGEMHVARDQTILRHSEPDAAGSSGDGGDSRMYGEEVAGTDIMGLFSYFIPDLDSVLYDEISGTYPSVQE